MDEGLPGDCKDWTAVQDHRNVPSRLRVEGRCDMPHPGYTVSLRRVEPQGINPAELLLERVVSGSPKLPDVIDPVTVTYEEEASTEYQTVRILPDRTEITVTHLH